MTLTLTLWKSSNATKISKQPSNFAILTGKHLCQSLFLIKNDFNTGISLWILKSFKDHLFWRTYTNGCFLNNWFLYDMQQSVEKWITIIFSPPGNRKNTGIWWRKPFSLILLKRTQKCIPINLVPHLFQENAMILQLTEVSDKEKEINMSHRLVWVCLTILLGWRLKG